MRDTAEASTAEYFNWHFGTRFEQLLTPVSEANPCGENLRNNGVYRAIQEARREDDPSLPMGPWTHELKKAEWGKVCELALDALVHKSKDLQIAAWLLEAQIQRDGFAAIAPCATLIRLLCERYWNALYPRADDADIEFRTNVIHWINEKLLPVLRQVPLTNTGRDERALNWADWEQAKRNEQHRSQQRQQQALEGVNALEFSSAMAGTPTQWHRDLYCDLDGALSSLEELTSALNSLCGADAPSLHQLMGLLEQIRTLAASELHKRGVSLDAPVEDSDPADGAEGHGELVSSAPLAALRDRATAYARLAEVAEYLQRIEPHSPVPYLVKRAVAWGNLNTAELYQEMFVRSGGRLEIFELLGLSVSRPGASA